jgi:hypothetical protein
MYDNKEYYIRLFQEMGIDSCQEAATPATATTTLTIDGDESVDSSRHALYRRMVGNVCGNIS